MPSHRRTFRPLIFVALAAALAACGGRDAQPEGEAAESPALGSPAAGDAASGTPAAVSAATAVDGDAAPTHPAMAPRDTGGRRRTVLTADAAANLPFSVYEPGTMPAGTYRPNTAHLIEANEGELSDALPAIRLIYDIDGGGALILLESPARGATLEGAENHDINGATGYLVRANEQILLVWEQDGVSFELRAHGVRLEEVLAAARSMVPLGTAPESAPPVPEAPVEGAPASPAEGEGAAGEPAVPAAEPTAEATESGDAGG